MVEPTGNLGPEQQAQGWVGQERPKGPSSLLLAEGGISLHRERKRLGNARSQCHACQVRRELQAWKGSLGRGEEERQRLGVPLPPCNGNSGTESPYKVAGNSDLGNASSCPVRGWHPGGRGGIPAGSQGQAWGDVLLLSLVAVPRVGKVSWRRPLSYASGWLCLESF